MIVYCFYPPVWRVKKRKEKIYLAVSFRKTPETELQIRTNAPALKAESFDAEGICIKGCC